MSDMVTSSYHHVKAIGIAAAAPMRWQALEEAVEAFVGDKSGFRLDKFKKNTGVEGRYLCNEHQTASDFAYAAAKALLEANNIEKSEIGILLFVSQMPDYNNPATACVLHKRLGLSTSCIAFDINLGCSGYIYGLNTGAALLQSSSARYALVLCGDTSAKDKSRGRNENRTSHGTLFLFGDGGAATLLEKADSSQIVVTSCTNGEGFDAIIMPEHSWRHPWSNQPRFIDDIRVFNFSIDKAPEMLNAYMKLQRTSPADYDALALHQANKLIMQTVGKRAGFPKEKILSSIETFANTSSASIPNTLVKEYGENDSNENLRLLCCGFGVGLSWAAMELNIAPCQILPLIHTDEWFDDGLPEE